MIATPRNEDLIFTLNKQRILPMKMKDLSIAIHGAILALSKLDKVLQEYNDEVITDGNSTAASEPIGVPTVDVETATGELDGEGRPWTKGIHAGTKGQVASKNVKGVKAWRLAKGLDKAKAEEFYATYPINVDAAPTAALPGTPTAALPGTPTAALPGAPTVDVDIFIRTEISTVLKSLIDNFGLTWDDLKELLVSEFDATQNGNEVTLGSLKTEQYKPLLARVTELETAYKSCKSIIEQIYTIATPANKAFVDTNILPYFQHFNTTELGGVHFSNVIELSGMLDTWLTQWKQA